MFGATTARGHDGAGQQRIGNARLFDDLGLQGERRQRRGRAIDEDLDPDRAHVVGAIDAKAQGAALEHHQRRR